MDNGIVEKARSIEVVTDEIKSLVSSAQSVMLGYAVEIGRRLVEAKDLLPHGEWGKWLREKVEFSQSSANNFMKLFEEYGDRQFTLFGAAVSNSQTFGNLSYTKALRLLAVPGEEREEFAEEHDVGNISVRELDRVIKERDEAVKRAEAAEKEALEAAAAEAKVSDAEERVAELEELLQKKNDELCAAAEKAKKAESETAALEAKIGEMKKNPNVPKAVLDRIEKEAKERAAQEAKANAEKSAEKSRKEIEALAAAKAEAERKLSEAREEAEAMRKKVETADPDAIRFRTLFDSFQATGHELKNTVEKIRERNAALADKFSAALVAVAKQMEE